MFKYNNSKLILNTSIFVRLNPVSLQFYAQKFKIIFLIMQIRNPFASIHALKQQQNKNFFAAAAIIIIFLIFTLCYHQSSFLPFYLWSRFIFCSAFESGLSLF